MPTVAVFDVDASVGPLAQDLMGIPIADTPEILVNVRGFLGGDAIAQASFTAKVNATDADNAPTTVQVVWIPEDGNVPGGPQVTPLGSAGAAYQFAFPLSAAQTAILATLHGYDIRVWVTRSGVTIDHTVQRGQILCPLTA
jgi:hypothetical protein